MLAQLREASTVYNLVRLAQLLYDGSTVSVMLALLQ